MMLDEQIALQLSLLALHCPEHDRQLSSVGSVHSAMSNQVSVQESPWWSQSWWMARTPRHRLRSLGPGRRRRALDLVPICRLPFYPLPILSLSICAGEHCSRCRSRRASPCHPRDLLAVVFPGHRRYSGDGGVRREERVTIRIDFGLSRWAMRSRWEVHASRDAEPTGTHASRLVSGCRPMQGAYTWRPSGRGEQQPHRAPVAHTIFFLVGGSGCMAVASKLQGTTIGRRSQDTELHREGWILINPWLLFID